MALPSNIGSASTIIGDQNYYCGPFKSSGGAFYAVLQNTGSGPRVYKASDPESTWTDQDTTTRQVNYSQWAFQDGDLLHIVGHRSSDLSYWQFNMATDLFTVDAQQIDDPKDAPASTDTACAIAARGAGDPVVALYAGDQDNVMGTSYNRIDYATRNTSGTWSSPTQAFGLASYEWDFYGAGIAPGTSNGLHLIGNSDRLVVSIRGNFIVRTLSSGDSLSSESEFSQHCDTLQVGPVSVDDAGTQRVLAIVRRAFSSAVGIMRCSESSGNLTVTDFIDFITNDAGVANTTPIGCLASDGSTVHAVYSQSSDSDLYHDQADAPHASGDWGTDTEHRDAVTINRISCNIYNRDGARKLAMVYDDGGTVKYDEIDIDVVPTNLSDVKFPQQSSYIGPYEI